MRRRLPHRRVARFGLALALMAAAIGALAGWRLAGSGDDQRLSAGFRHAALAPCAQFDREIKGYRVGAGAEDWIRMATAFRAARARLSRRLSALAHDPGDRRKLRPLLDRIAEGSTQLARSADRARVGDLDGQIRADRRYDAVFAKQRAITVRLGLGACGG